MKKVVKVTFSYEYEFSVDINDNEELIDFNDSVREFEEYGSSVDALPRYFRVFRKDIITKDRKIKIGI